MSKSEKILPSVYTLLGFPLKMSVFICHSSDTDRLVKSLQNEITNLNNIPDNLVEWTIRDWHTLPHIQSSGDKDCQDVINEQLDNASIIVFVVKERIGHYLLREWFYSLRYMDTKTVIFFKDDYTCHIPEVEYRIALMHPDHYLVPNNYKSSKNLILSLFKILTALALHKTVDILESSKCQVVKDKLHIYTDQIDHILTQISELGVRSIEGPLAERFDRIAGRFSPKQIENYNLHPMDVTKVGLNRIQEILPIRQKSIDITPNVQNANLKSVK